MSKCVIGSRYKSIMRIICIIIYYILYTVTVDACGHTAELQKS